MANKNEIFILRFCLTPNQNNHGTADIYHRLGFRKENGNEKGGGSKSPPSELPASPHTSQDRRLEVLGR